MEERKLCLAALVVCVGQLDFLGSHSPSFRLVTPFSEIHQNNLKMKEYDPSQYLISSSISTSTDYAFILLNQPISQEQKPIFETLWRNGKQSPLLSHLN